MTGRPDDRPGDLEALAWPTERIGEALEAVARASGLGRPAAGPMNPPPALKAAGGDPARDDRLSWWIEDACHHLGLECAPLDLRHGDLGTALAGSGPALLALPDSADSAGTGGLFLALVRGGGRASGRGHVTVMTPQHDTRVVSIAAVRERLGRALARAEAPGADPIVGLIGNGRRAERARAVLLARRVRGRIACRAWPLRRARPSLIQMARAIRLPGRLARLVLAYVAELALLVAAWRLVGAGALAGRLEPGWLWAWALVLVTTVGLRAAASWNAGALAISAGSLLREKLLRGVLNLDPSRMREQGAGQLLGRVLQAEAVETLAVGGGQWTVAAVFELGLAALILGVFAGSAGHVALLAAMVVAIGWSGARHLQGLRAWTEARRHLTHDLVERMVGHRTLVAQQDPARWHDGEETALARYEELGRDVDRHATRLALLPRLWLLAGIAWLAPGFATGSLDTAALAVTVGGILVGEGALRRFTLALPALSGAAVAWLEVAPIFRAGRAKPSRGGEDVPLPIGGPAPAAGAPAGGSTGPAPLLVARELMFKHQDRSRAVLDGLTVEIRPGDQILLEGESGEGKSTLGALVGGLRAPQGGVLLLHGLDHHSLGSARWRRHVALVPQFHDNHVFGATLLFNLVMGRSWPARQEDIDECHAICAELGLGDLIARMPAGLQQTVGETGWQLSHGERSRLFLARALLQNADLRVFDETLAALDPQTLRQVMPHVLRRAGTLMLIAHP